MKMLVFGGLDTLFTACPYPVTPWMQGGTISMVTPWTTLTKGQAVSPGLFAPKSPHFSPCL